MNLFYDIWDQVASIGLDGIEDSRVKRKVKLTNQIVFVAGLMSFIQLFAFANVPAFAIMCMLSLALYTVTFWFNSRGWHNAARLYFCIISCLCILVGAGLLSSSGNISARFMLVQAFVVPMVIFDVREVRLQIIGALFFIASFLSFNHVIEAIPMIDGISPEEYNNHSTLLFNGMLCMITLLLGNRYLQKLNFESEENLIASIDLANDQRQEIEDKNAFIKKGIGYAKRIQEAVLPKEEDLKVYLPDHFVHFKPKDIIGGDFYWYGEYDEHIIIATIDCTGHGAPGALISLIGNQMLNKIVKEKGITDPGEILEVLNLEVIKTLNTVDDSVLQEGMDISMLSIDTRSRKIRFAGAKNSVVVVRNGQVERLRGEGVSIGDIHRLAEGFTSHVVNVGPSDSIYLFTDGIIDQFGGPESKKFLHKRLYSVLQANHMYSMEIQANCLKRELMNWQTSHPQIDDILIIGLRVDFNHISHVRSFVSRGRTVIGMDSVSRAS